MGIALLALAGLFNRLSTAPRATSRASATQRHPARIHPVWAQRAPVCSPSHTPAETPVGTLALPNTTALTTASQQRPAALRVMRVREQDASATCAGRMVISGRMADVCAELDRLVAIEARQASA